MNLDYCPDWLLEFRGPLLHFHDHFLAFPAVVPHVLNSDPIYYVIIKHGTMLALYTFYDSHIRDSLKFTCPLNSPLSLWYKLTNSNPLVNKQMLRTYLIQSLQPIVKWQLTDHRNNANNNLSHSQSSLTSQYEMTQENELKENLLGRRPESFKSHWNKTKHILTKLTLFISFHMRLDSVGRKRLVQMRTFFLLYYFIMIRDS